MIFLTQPNTSLSQNGFHSSPSTKNGKKGRLQARIVSTVSSKATETNSLERFGRAAARATKQLALAAKKAERTNSTPPFSSFSKEKKVSDKPRNRQKELWKKLSHENKKKRSLERQKGLQIKLVGALGASPLCLSDIKEDWQEKNSKNIYETSWVNENYCVDEKTEENDEVSWREEKAEESDDLTSFGDDFDFDYEYEYDYEISFILKPNLRRGEKDLSIVEKFIKGVRNEGDLQLIETTRKVAALGPKIRKLISRLRSEENEKALRDLTFSTLTQCDKLTKECNKLLACSKKLRGCIRLSRKSKITLCDYWLKRIRKEPEVIPYLLKQRGQSAESAKLLKRFQNLEQRRELLKSDLKEHKLVKEALKFTDNATLFL